MSVPCSAWPWHVAAMGRHLPASVLTAAGAVPVERGGGGGPVGHTHGSYMDFFEFDCFPVTASGFGCLVPAVTGTDKGPVSHRSGTPGATPALRLRGVRRRLLHRAPDSTDRDFRRGTAGGPGHPPDVGSVGVARVAGDNWAGSPGAPSRFWVLLSARFPVLPRGCAEAHTSETFFIPTPGAGTRGVAWAAP